MIDPEAITEAKRALGRQLAAYRDAAGFNQHQLAPKIHYGRSTVANAETGRSICSRVLWERCDKALGADGALIRGYDELKALTREQHLEMARLMETKRATRLGQAHEQRSVVETTGSPGHGSASGFGQRAITAADVETVRELTQTFRRLDNKFGGGRAHSLAAQYLDSNVASMLRGGQYSEVVGQELFAAAAQLAHLVAWTSYDMQEHERAQWYFAKALELTVAADDRAFGGEILAARSHQAIHLGRPTEAVELARASQQTARTADVPALLSEAHALEAIGQALLGDPRACAASLNESERAFEQSTPDNVPEWLRYLDEGYLAARFAHCFRDLKDWTHAHEYALRAVNMSEGLARTRVFNTAMLATAYVETDVEQAYSVGLDALRLATDLQSTRVVHYIRDFRNRLTEHHGQHPVVSQFAEQAVELLGVD